MRQGTVVWLVLALAVAAALVAFSLQGPRANIVGVTSLALFGLVAAVLVRGFRVPPFPL